ncbi:response regulator [Microlunatus sp. GCM10028923]|uniref:response regulator n=1 Tax=Microlunatus sp. GCM10028923 TaxID=3273400 RepID=UPI0036217871
MDEIKILIVDDQPLVRHGVGSVIADEPGMIMVGEAGNGIEAIRDVRRHHPDVVLMDINMPRMDGLEATRQLCADGRPGPKVIILTMYDQDEHVFEALRAGASGFLLKESTGTQLVEAVRAVASGDALLSPTVTRMLIREFVRRPALGPTTDGTGLAALTGREYDVFLLLVQGYNNAEIAQHLVLGESTIKSHVQHLYQKLGVRDRVQVVIYAYENGISSGSPPPGVEDRPRGEIKVPIPGGRQRPDGFLVS